MKEIEERNYVLINAVVNFINKKYIEVSIHDLPSSSFDLINNRLLYFAIGGLTFTKRLFLAYLSEGYLIKWR